MTIKEGWYISECTSETEPHNRLDGNTFYLPVNVQKDDESGFCYSEYRFNLPVNYEMPCEVYGLLCNALASNQHEYLELEQRTAATEDALMELASIIAEEGDKSD